MGVSYILDTNIIISLQKGILNEVLPLKTKGISVITEMELRSFPHLNETQIFWLIRFIGSVPVLPLDEKVKETAIMIRSQKKVKLPDAIIAATAIVHHAVLLTNDMNLHTVEGLECQSLAVKQGNCHLPENITAH